MAFLSGLAPIIKENEPLAAHTWFGLGGAARWLARPRNVEELSELVCRCRARDVRLYRLGQGANLLVEDDGVNGVVIRLHGPVFRRMDWDLEEDEGAVGGPSAAGDTVLVRAGGGVDLNRLVLDSVRRGLAGLECLAGIPGTLGGAIRMNAGGRFGQIADVVRSVQVVDKFGDLGTRARPQIGFDYRSSDLHDAIITEAVLELRRGDPEEIRRRFMEIWDYKKRTQPLGYPSAGCMFKNPPGQSAGALIDRAGLKGYGIGGAYVSTEHANFIIAKEGATARDVLALIGHIRQRVAERFGVELELEIEIWGRQHVPSAALVTEDCGRE